MSDFATRADPRPAADEIVALAREHGIAHRRSRLDDLGDAMTRLAGDEVEFDEVEWLLVELGRAGAIGGVECTRLHARYLRERRAK